MTKIKLARYGRKKAPFYRIVVATLRSKRDGKPVDVLGFWNPKGNEVKIDKQKLSDWQKKGAKISVGVAKLLA